MAGRKRETSAEWHVRMMRETEGLTKPGEILAHLAADHEKNGPPGPYARGPRATPGDQEDQS